MEFHPILFTTPMVQAILEDRKTMTRRTIKPQPNERATEMLRTGQWKKTPWVAHFPYEHNKEVDIYEVTDVYKCRYGKLGDILWVREEMYQVWNDGVYYKADNTKWEQCPPDYHYRNSACTVPNLHMPKIACRLFLEITDIRVERLQSISDRDAIAEGVAHVIDKITGYCGYDYIHGGYNLMTTPYHGFRSLWRKINGDESWKANPWVWVVSFKRVEKPINFINCEKPGINMSGLIQKSNF